MAKYIKFSDSGESYSRKAMYDITNKKSGDCLGMIFWYPPWHLWVARFKEESVWSAECLADVQAFMATLAQPRATP